LDTQPLASTTKYMKHKSWYA